MALTTNNSQADFNTLIRQTTAGILPDKNMLTNATGTVHTIFIDNSSGSSTNFLKIYDTAVVTHGTTAPIFCVPVAASASMRVYSKQGITISSALSICASSGAATGGSAPGGTIAYRIFGT
jgi:hypothetical protein